MTRKIALAAVFVMAASGLAAGIASPAVAESQSPCTVKAFEPFMYTQGGKKFIHGQAQRTGQCDDVEYRVRIIADINPSSNVDRNIASEDGRGSTFVGKAVYECRGQYGPDMRYRTEVVIGPFGTPQASTHGSKDVKVTNVGC